MSQQLEYEYKNIFHGNVLDEKVQIYMLLVTILLKPTTTPTLYPIFHLEYNMMMNQKLLWLMLKSA